MDIDAYVGHLYVLCAKKFEHTWQGFSLESFRYVLTGLKLALPSAAMVCLEYWAFEILVLMEGLMPYSEQTTSLIAMCVNTETIAYMMTYGLSAAVSIRVSNELGAGNPDGSRKAMAVTLKLSVLLSLILAFDHNIWAGLFSDSPAIIHEFASMTLLLIISLTVYRFCISVQGVARGCGWQHLAVYVNLGTFHLIGMTVAGLLGFKMKLYAKGLWIVLICVKGEQFHNVVDYVTTEIRKIGEHDAGLFAIFSGLGNPQVAQYLWSFLFPNVITHPA
ncbi:hypothetical protein M0R45_002208 [Rubus argutus]|uniref:Uncharacterized protein n=1 Tax=Rubus argutus TaxID=59490 RepID=A0AAW1VNI4_RUBAR